MNALEKLKHTSFIARVMVFIVLGLIIVTALFGFFTEGRWWISFGDDAFNQMWQTYPDAKNTLSLLILPAVIVLLLATFFLQKLLQQLSLGLFYSNISKSCLKWLAWLCFFGVIYNMLLNPLASILIAPEQDIEISIRPLTLIVVFCLPVLVHLFNAASELDKENKEII